MTTPGTSSTIDAENWIKLLYGYAPVLENHGQTSEKVGNLEKRTKIKRLNFTHPAKATFEDALIPQNRGQPKNVLLMGTAGDGKTHLMVEGKARLTEEPAIPNKNIERFETSTGDGTKKFTFIYDLSGWRGQGALNEAQIELIKSFARSVAGQGDEMFVIAANDGALHQILEDDFPTDVSSEVEALKTLINKLHSGGKKIANDGEPPANLRLFNLSLIASEQTMKECLAAILDRTEWQAPEFETGTGIFAPTSSIIRNYKLLNTPTVRRQLITLAKIADCCGFHLSIRDVLCLIVNAILGHPKVNGGILRPNDQSSAAVADSPDDAPLHFTFFGEQLSGSSRAKRRCYTFLSLLQVGTETTNELDDLLIFGALDQNDPELKQEYQKYVANDPHGQKSKTLETLARQYVTGDITEDESNALRRELGKERRRLFISADRATMEHLRLWKCTAFHHAGLYLEAILTPLNEGKKISPTLIRQLVTGLNRTWTGFLINEQCDTLYLCSGLDVTTAPVSDLIEGEISIQGYNGDAIRMEIDPETKGTGAALPQVIFDSPVKKNAFRFALTLPRFEFLMRVAEGVMPTSFSREATEDFSILKQKCMRDMCNKSSEVLYSITLDETGHMGRTTIHIQE